MEIGQKLREIRTARNLSQGDIEKRSGLRRCYVSRVENGFTVPNVETLEKWARAMEIPLYQLFYDGQEPPILLTMHKGKTGDGNWWGSSGEDARTLARFRGLLKRAGKRDRELLILLAQKMAGTATRRAKD